MKLTRLEARNISLSNKEITYMNKLKKSGEAALYFKLRNDYPDGYVGDMSVVEYVEMLKKELEPENNVQQ